MRNPQETAADIVERMREAATGLQFGAREAVLKAADEIARLRARVEELEGEKARLRDAGSPFAAVADEYDDGESDDFEVWMDAGPQRNIRSTFKLGMYRKLRATLHPTDEESRDG